jgi:polysaccharide biosynthesis/export protein
MGKLKWLAILILAISGCTGSKNLTYLNNLSKSGGPEYFPYKQENYQIQYRDILYIDIKATNSEGKIEDILQGSGNVSMNYIQNEASQYLIGFTVDKDGIITLPVLGKIEARGKTLAEIRDIIQVRTDKAFKRAYVEVKLLSFKFTVLGEVKSPGTYFCYSAYLTIFEALGEAGGIGDYGKRNQVIVIRTTPNGAKTYSVNLQDKNILSSEAYFLMPNDVIIVEPYKHKIFNLNLPTISFVVTTITGIITTSLLLINYFK